MRVNLYLHRVLLPDGVVFSFSEPFTLVAVVGNGDGVPDEPAYKYMESRDPYAITACTRESLHHHPLLAREGAVVEPSMNNIGYERTLIVATYSVAPPVLIPSEIPQKAALVYDMQIVGVDPAPSGGWVLAPGAKKFQFARFAYADGTQLWLNNDPYAQPITQYQTKASTLAAGWYVASKV